jgi:small subunit ribosomal protein S16
VLSIRLTRKGAKKRPFYRIVVTERDAKRDGRFVEIVGYYDPIAPMGSIKVDRARYDYWIARGAKPTDTVRRCLRSHDKAAAAATS